MTDPVNHPPHHPGPPLLALPARMTAEQVMALARIAEIIDGSEQRRRINELLAANTAEVERRRSAEQVLRDQNHSGVYADSNRLGSLADPDLTGSTVQRVEQTVARLRRVARAARDLCAGVTGLPPVLTDEELIEKIQRRWSDLRSAIAEMGSLPDG